MLIFFLCRASEEIDGYRWIELKRHGHEDVSRATVMLRIYPNSWVEYYEKNGICKQWQKEELDFLYLILCNMTKEERARCVKSMLTAINGQLDNISRLKKDKEVKINVRNGRFNRLVLNEFSFGLCALENLERNWTDLKEILAKKL